MTIYQPTLDICIFVQVVVHIVEIIASPGAKQKFCKDHWRNDLLLSSSLLRANGTIVLHRIVNNLFGFSYYNFRVIISQKSCPHLCSLSLSIIIATGSKVEWRQSWPRNSSIHKWASMLSNSLLLIMAQWWKVAQKVSFYKHCKIQREIFIFKIFYSKGTVWVFLAFLKKILKTHPKLFCQH